MPAGVKTSAEPLANELARCEVLPTTLALDIVRQLAHEIARRHESGRLHLHVAADMVSFDSETGRAELREPTDASRSFGGMDRDDEFCPPELLRTISVSIAVDLAAARDALQAAGLASVEPRRIDVYQSGTLLCRMLTGQGVSDFLSRPRVAAKVPPEVRELIERASGHDSQRAFRSADELLRALEALDASKTQALPNLAGSTRNDAKPDTKPSFVGVGAADTDSGRPAPVPLDDAALPFRKLGHYEIVGRLGRGGMGDVYKGYEPRLDRQVAIKVLPAEFSRQDEMVQRFYAEASAAAKLVHPNTVEIFFVGQDEVSVAEGQAPSTLHFFAMRFVEGESLAELLSRRKNLNVEDTLAIIEQALAGLSAAHRLGMVHRDIKPGNILIDRERQRVLLADFGLVKTLQAAASLTASGVIVGTVDYMAPEQGRGAAVDARADLYAIGVVLYQMLSGRLPFQADSATGLIFQHVYESAPPLHEVAPDVPRPLSDIVAKLMAKFPDARYQNVETLLSDLRAFHQDQPLPSAGVSISGTPDRPRTVIIPAPRFADEVVLPATLTQLAVRNPWQRRRQAIRDFFLVPSTEIVQQIQSTEHQVDGAIAEFERRQKALDNSVREAEAVVQELETQQQIWQRAITDAEQRAANAPDDDTARAALAEKLRGERVLAELAEQFETQQSQLDEMRHKRSQVTATLERLRSQRDVLNARLKVARAQIHLAGGDVKTLRGPRWIARVRWQNVAKIGLVLAVVVGASAFVMEMAAQVFRDSGYARDEVIPLKVIEPLKEATAFNELFHSTPNQFGQPFAGCDKPVTKLAVSPKGKHVAAATGDRDVFVWDTESGKLLHRLSENLRQVHTIAFSPDGKILVTGEAFNSQETPLKFWDPATGTRMGELPMDSKALVKSIAFSPTGSLMACSYLGHDTQVWDYETRSEVWTIPASKNVGQLVFSGDGSLLITTRDRGEIVVWDVNEKKLLKSWFDDSLGSWRFGPLLDGDGVTLVIGGELGIARWNPRTGEKLSRTGGVLPQPKGGGAMSPDGRWVAVANEEGIAILESQTGVLTNVIPGHKTRALAFSPQGNHLFTGGGPPYVVRWETKSAVPVGKAPAWEVEAGPLLALAHSKPLGVIVVGTSIGLWNYQIRSSAMILANSSMAEPSSATFSQDARRVAVLDRRGVLQAWDVDSGQRIQQKQISDNTEVAQIRFEEDSDFVWVTTSTHLWRINLRGGTPEAWLEWPANTGATALSPDLRVAVISTNVPSQVQAWDIASRQPIFRENEFPHGIVEFAFASDSRRLLGISATNEYFHWDLERRELLTRFPATPEGPPNRQSKLAFLADRRHFLSLHPPTLSVVDLETHRDILTLRTSTSPDYTQSHKGFHPANQLHVTPDGRFAVTDGGGSNRTLFWDLHLQQNLGRENLDREKAKVGTEGKQP